ncbi:MAG TPA: HIT family protein [Bacteroidales bacterium]|nr:HIT family protein [Bacteroidales bacterium]HRZ77361.1 HIT family protein [Bacteroidales bacterium]
MPSIFTRIVNGEIPAWKVAENAHCLAFLDINPLAEGHTLVIPKMEVDNLWDLEPELFTELMRFAHQVARALGKVSSATKVGMAVIGLEVPHAHIHLVPINGVNDIDFRKEKLKFSPEEFKAIADRIASAL